MMNYKLPASRREVFNLSERDFNSAESIATAVKDWPPASLRVSHHYDKENFPAIEKSIEKYRQQLRGEGFNEDQIDSHILRSFGPQTIADKPELLSTWVLTLNSQTLTLLKKDLYESLDEIPSWSWESEYAFMVGSNEIITSTFFEKFSPDVLSNLGVCIAEVETRRTSYNIAKLMKSTTEATAIAQNMGLQLIFT